MKIDCERQILNSIIPNHWIAKAVADALNGNRREEFHERTMNMKCNSSDRIFPCGKWLEWQLKPNSYSQLTTARNIWIHMIGSASRMVTQRKIEQLLRRNRIDFARAKVTVSISGRARTWSYGVVVDIEDASRAILLIRPKFLEQRRAAITTGMSQLFKHL